MATIVDLFLDRRPKLGRITLDCSLSETHEAGHEMSPYPVEGGSNRNDHFVDLPDAVTIEGVVSDVALFSFLGVSFSEGFDARRSLTAWEELKKLQRSHEPFLLVTGFGAYTSMVFDDGASLIATRTPEDSNVLHVTMRLVKYRVAYTTFAEALAAEVADLAEQAAIAGIEGSTPADPASAAAAAGAV